VHRGLEPATWRKGVGLLYHWATSEVMCHYRSLFTYPFLHRLQESWKNSMQGWDSNPLPHASRAHLLPLGHFMSCGKLKIV
jgi:hypothetical protein